VRNSGNKSEASKENATQFPRVSNERRNITEAKHQRTKGAKIFFSLNKR